MKFDSIYYMSREITLSQKPKRLQLQKIKKLRATIDELKSYSPKSKNVEDQKYQS